MTGKPGQQFEYGAYHLNTFAYALERKLGKETFEAHLKRRILDPIGIKVEWRFRCTDGHPQVGGGGKPTLAQAGGKDPPKQPDALALARKLASEQVAG